MVGKNSAKTRAESERDLAFHVPGVELVGGGYIYTGKVPSPKKW